MKGNLSSFRLSVVCFLAGITLASAFSVSAEQIKSALIGKKIESVKDIRIDNGILSEKAIAVSGKIYMPIINASSILGFSIKQVTKTDVILERASGNYFGQLKSSAIQQQEFMIEYSEILNLKNSIVLKIDSNNKDLKRLNDDLIFKKKEVEFAENQNSLDLIRNRISDLERQISTINNDTKSLDQIKTVLELSQNHYYNIGKDIGINFPK